MFQIETQVENTREKKKTKVKKSPTSDVAYVVARYGETITFVIQKVESIVMLYM